MEDAEIRLKAQQILENFDSLKNSEPSEAWQESLKQRLSETPPSTNDRFSTKHYTYFILFFVLLNGAFIFSFLKKNTPPQYSEHSFALKTISKELLTDARNN